MTDQAKLHLRVQSVMDSIAYYRDHLGWTLINEDGAGDNARMSIVPGYTVVLSRDDAHSEWLDTIAHKPSRGDCFYVGVPAIEAIRINWIERGTKDYQIVEEPGSIRKLMVSTPDDYTVIYWEELHPSAEEILQMYRDGVNQLREALRGLDDRMLDLAMAPGKWSIRQHTLHLIDLELVTIHKVKFALAESGKSFIGTSFTQESWSRGLDYAHRPIEPEVQLFALLREHILGMCSSLPLALERYVRTADKIETVERLLKMMAGHANHHIRTIREIRAYHAII